MDNTRNTLRRLWVYGLIVVCSIGYSAMHPTSQDQALERARAVTSHAIEWIAGHVNRGPK